MGLKRMFAKNGGYYLIVIGFIALIIGLLNLQTYLISHYTSREILLIPAGALFIFIGLGWLKRGKYLFYNIVNIQLEVT